jgi:hypothetical protein
MTVESVPAARSALYRARGVKPPSSLHQTPAVGRDGSILVLDDGVRAVSAAGGFRVPLALVILVLDGFRVARDFLLLGGGLRGCERLGMGLECFRKYAVDFIGPAAVVLDDLLGDIRHGTSFGFAVL